MHRLTGYFIFLISCGEKTKKKVMIKLLQKPLQNPPPIVVMAWFQTLTQQH
ncbi:MAG: hypothetical protein IPN56_14875 [Chitinophagaceae bacterium]|nr:hypothetical protein [Chitinophagaceae bacterium]